MQRNPVRPTFIPIAVVNQRGGHAFGITPILCSLERSDRVVAFYIAIRAETLRHRLARHLGGLHRVSLLVEDIVHVRRFRNRVIRVRRIAAQARYVLGLVRAVRDIDRAPADGTTRSVPWRFSAAQ